MALKFYAFPAKK